MGWAMAPTLRCGTILKFNPKIQIQTTGLCCNTRRPYPLHTLGCTRVQHPNCTSLLARHSVWKRRCPVVSWQVQYVWFMLLYCAYMAVLLAIGSAVNIGFFRKNSYGLQIVSRLRFMLSVGHPASGVPRAGSRLCSYSCVLISTACANCHQSCSAIRSIAGVLFRVG